MKVRIEVDGAIRVEKSLNRVSNTILTHENVIVWFKKFADPYMRKQFRKSFETRTSPGGRNWFNKVDGTSATLRKRGNLMRSVTQKRGNVRISAGFGQRNIEMVWGHKDGGGNIVLKLKGGFDKFKIHQLGSGGKGMTRKGQKIPARPMIGFRKGDSAHLGRSLNLWITNQMRSI